MTPFAGQNRVTSAFGPRKSPITGRAEQHRGQDIVPTNGNWAVRECTGGTVVRVAYDNARGKYVDVQTSSKIFERYQHMDSIAVAVGQAVPQGTVLGFAGSTGAVTGRHLHFGVYKNGTAEACAISSELWSGVPNFVGTYPGNDDLDSPVPAAEAPASPTAPVPSGAVLHEYGGIVASPGDGAALETLLRQLRIPFVKKEVRP